MMKACMKKTSPRVFTVNFQQKETIEPKTEEFINFI